MNKLVAIIFLLLLCISSISGMAQSKNKTSRQVSKSSKSSQQTALNHLKPFVGKIIYRAEPSTFGAEEFFDMIEAANDFVSDPMQDDNPHIEKNKNIKTIALSHNKEHDKAVVYVSPEGVLTQIGDMGMISDKENTIHVWVRPDGGEAIFRAFYPDFEVDRFFANVDQPYTATEDTRLIAGIKATRYVSNIPMIEGDIWVATELTVGKNMVPFLNMPHPVLEADFSIILNNELIRRVHFVAVEIITNDDALSVDETILKFISTDEHALDEVMMELRRNRDDMGY